MADNTVSQTSAPSSGSGAAASANFAVLAFGSETDGGIVCPSNTNGVVPISHTQDTVGPLARTVADAAADPIVPTPQPVLDAFEAAVEALTAAGATVIDLDAAGFTFPSAGGESLVLDYDFRNDVISALQVHSHSHSHRSSDHS